MNDEEVIYQLRNQLRDRYEFSQALTDEQLLKLVEETVFHWSTERKLSTAEKLELVKGLYYSFRGLDILQPLLDDPTITEIMINNENIIFVEQAGRMKQLTLQFESRERLEDIIQQIVSVLNRVVNESSPIVDARLIDGSRVNIVLPPISLHGPAVTIRKFPEQPLTMQRLIEIGAISADAGHLLSLLVKAKFNIFISGGTGSGKTTFLNVLSDFIPEEERIITIEDAAELQLRNIKNLVSLETRNANTEGKGAITIRDLIRASLRMRPNRIIVGEVRGKEALDMLQAMNTGHEGSMSTGHANTPKDMLSRLETMVLSDSDLPLAVVRQQISSAIDIIIHLTRFPDHRRGVSMISQVTGMKQGEIQLEPLFELTTASKANEFASSNNQLLRSKHSIFRKEKLLQAGLQEEELWQFNDTSNF